MDWFFFRFEDLGVGFFFWGRFSLEGFLSWYFVDVLWLFVLGFGFIYFFFVDSMFFVESKGLFFLEGK